jgi:MoxR-like ATPase
MGKSPESDQSMSGVVESEENKIREGMAPPIFHEKDVLNSPELATALNAERLTYELKVSREELLAYLDEINKYINYKDVLDSGILSKLPVDNELYAEAKKLISGAESENDQIAKIVDSVGDVRWDEGWGPYFRNTRGKETEDEKVEALKSIGWDDEKIDRFMVADIDWNKNKETAGGKASFPLDDAKKQLLDKYKGSEDFDEQLFEATFKKIEFESVEQPDKKGLGLDGLEFLLQPELEDEFGDLLYDAIKEDATQKELDGGLDIRRPEIQSKIESITLSETDRINTRIDAAILPILDKLASFTPKEDKMITSYLKSQKSSVGEYLKLLRRSNATISIASEGRNAEFLATNVGLADKLNTTSETVDKSRNRTARSHRRRTGREIATDRGSEIAEVNRRSEKEFLSAYVKWGRELRSMYNLLHNGEIVETKYLKESVIDLAMPMLKKNPPAVVFFHGDFGTGKTALARHIAKTRFHKDAIVVPCHKYMEPEQATEEYRIQALSKNEHAKQIFTEVYGKDKVAEMINEGKTTMELQSDLLGSMQDWRASVMKLRIETKFADDEAAKEEALSKPLEDNFDAKELADLDKQIENFYSNPVMGRYMMQALYRGMDTGTPVIFDEANTLPPEVMIAFYDAFTKKFGQTIDVKSDEGKITVKEGFCIMMTGNTGTRYDNSARHNDFDPAFYSRLFPIRLRYLPNADQIDIADKVSERLDLGKLKDEILHDDDRLRDAVKFSQTGDPSQEDSPNASHDQIFQVLLTRVLNRRLGVRVLAQRENPEIPGSGDRYKFFKDLYRLSIGARILMNLFESQNVNVDFINNLRLGTLIGASDSTTITKKLKTTNLSMRELIDNFISGYEQDHGNLDVEYYLFNNYIKNRPVEEKAIIFAIMRQVGFFKVDGGWPEYENITGTKDKALAEFDKVMEINPLTEVKKYEQFANGESVGMLKTENTFEEVYINSLESMQLMFGFIPARKSGEYIEVAKNLRKIEAVSQKRVEAVRINKMILDFIKDKFLPPIDLVKQMNDTAEEAKKFPENDSSPEAKKAREAASEAITGISNWMTPKYNDSANAQRFSKFFREGGLSDTKKNELLSDDEYVHNRNLFLDGVANFALEFGWIDENEANLIKGTSDLAAKANLLQNALNGI